MVCLCEMNDPAVYRLVPADRTAMRQGYLILREADHHVVLGVAIFGSNRASPLDGSSCTREQCGMVGGGGSGQVGHCMPSGQHRLLSHRYGHHRMSCVYMYISYMYMYMDNVYTYTHTCTYTCTYVHTHIHNTHIHIHTCIHTHTYIHIHTYIHTHTDIHILLNIHTHTHSFCPNPVSSR